MTNLDGQILLSASDLTRFMGCRHATTLDLAQLRGHGPQPCEGNAEIELLRKQRFAHELSYRAALEAAGKSVVEIEGYDLARGEAATRAALADCAEVVFRGAFFSGAWGGWFSFLERVNQPSELGQFSYQVTGVTLKRRRHPEYVLQLVLYSELLAEVQGVMPECAHFLPRDGTPTPLNLADYSDYARVARNRLESFVANPEPTRPVPCPDCALCRWSDHCAEVWQADDSLFNVANISHRQVKTLETANITTVAALAAHEGSAGGMVATTRNRVIAQARLQHARKTGTPTFELRPQQPGTGFDLLPEPQPGDVFYDIEGDPFFKGGLEYLHGLLIGGCFRVIWAHNHAHEERALRDLLKLFRDHLARFPTARIYHYAPYEMTALRRLTMKYGIGEPFLDRLQRERRFVDLFAVVRGGLIGSESDYSLKSMEAFYELRRDGDVQTAGGSLAAYETWRESHDPTILDEIKDYNRADCRSTEMLRDWLVAIRPQMPWPQLGEVAEEKEKNDDDDIEVLRAQLASADLAGERRKMLFDLGLFHRREAKPACWAVFESVAKEEAELLDDLDALGGLAALAPARTCKQSMTRRYRFPEQETKLRSGSRPTTPVDDGPPASVSIVDMDHTARTVIVRAGKAKAHVLTDRLTLHPEWPIKTDVIAASLRDVIDDQCGRLLYRAAEDLLSAAAPRLIDGNGDILAEGDVVGGSIAAVARMDETVLPIQGPPGTGKTYVAARAILSLVRAGHRVGVASNSHAAIRNLLMTCLSALPGGRSGVRPVFIHKISQKEDGYAEGADVQRTGSNDNAANNGDVVGGTAFFFSRDQNLQKFDWLFVDEAGQVGLANMVAMSRAARNIVLIGDPRQLPQVVRGAHPKPAGLSCLEWMLGDDITVPPDRGIFLRETRRMHPKLCSFISNRVYSGRLGNHSDTARQRVSHGGYPGAGAYWVPVAHEGNAQVAAEEVEAIRTAANDLRSGKWTDKHGKVRPICYSDIIVVAPYNAQVNALREGLPATIRVGTVDKFQGQEAPICLVSMTASSVGESRRGLDFLFSINRINVAVSRAKALALVLGAPRLLEAKCATIEQMRLVNTLCALEKLPRGRACGAAGD